MSFKALESKDMADYVELKIKFMIELMEIRIMKQFSFYDMDFQMN